MAARRRRLELDEAIDQVGSFGKFQLFMFALLFPVALFHGARMTSSSFFMHIDGYRCALPFLKNDTFETRSEYQKLHYNMSIPPGDFCHIYSLDYIYESDEYNRPMNASDHLQPCPNGWVYDDSEIHRTAVSQLDLVCDNSLYRSHASTLLYLGSLLGSTVLGFISDRYGRKTCLMLSVVMFVAFGLALPFVTNFAGLGAFEFLVGAASTGMFASAFVMGLELVKPKDRMVPGLVIQIFFTFGEIILAALFFGLRDWRWVEIVISAPAVLILFYYWLVPESPRWLMVKKKYSMLSKVLKKIERINKVQISVNNGSDDDLEQLLESYDARVHERPAVARHDSFFDMFKSCTLCQRACTIFFNWLAVNMIFYGFVLNSAHLKAGDIFLNFIVGAVVEIPAHLTTLTLVGRVGRKPVHCSLLLLVAVTSGAAIGVAMKCDDEHQWIVMVLAMIGKFGAAGLMGTSFLWMTELFPTSIRSSGLGVSSSFARAGAMLAPYIVQFGVEMNSHVGTALPFMIFCIASLLAFLFDLRLPETNHRALPDTVADAKVFGRSLDPLVSTPSASVTVNYGSFSASTSQDSCDDSQGKNNNLVF